MDSSALSLWGVGKPNAVPVETGVGRFRGRSLFRARGRCQGRLFAFHIGHVGGSGIHPPLDVQDDPVALHPIRQIGFMFQPGVYDFR